MAMRKVRQRSRRRRRRLRPGRRRRRQPKRLWAARLRRPARRKRSRPRRPTRPRRRRLGKAMSEQVMTSEQLAATDRRNEKVGHVVSTKMQKTIVVEVEMRKAHPKYKRTV